MNPLRHPHAWGMTDALLRQLRGQVLHSHIRPNTSLTGRGHEAVFITKLPCAAPG